MAKKRILIVDDELDLVTIVQLRLEAGGYEVIVAYDGQDGLAKAQKEKPDLIILDLMMPRIDGHKVCGLLKADARYNKIPIIIYSARGQDEDVRLAEEVGADAYVLKSIEIEELLNKTKELLKE